LEESLAVPCLMQHRKPYWPTNISRFDWDSSIWQLFDHGLLFSKNSLKALYLQATFARSTQFFNQMLLNILKFIYQHPFNSDNKTGALIGFLKWQLNTRLNPYPIIYPYTEKTKLLIWKGMTGATGNIYCGLIEFEDMGFLLHFLRPEDTFIDIGANVGAYTILASGEIGARTITIEPVPSTFQVLCDNILLNRLEDKVEALNIGLGKEKGIIKFTSSLDTINHVATEEDIDSIEVELDTLDNIVHTIPSLIKMDVEGFETEVVNGAAKTLQNRQLKAIIIELNGSGNRYGYDENLIHQKLLSLAFLPYHYNPFTRELKERISPNVHNTLYLRDIPMVKDRVTSARKIKVKNRQF
jgi:FkbM family methyltransferase